MKKSSELLLAIAAAKKGAKVALSYFETDLEISMKPDNSAVSVADRETENAIKKYILKRDPKAEFLAEESGGNKSGKRLWIIDPIDGTRQFIRGIPTWCVLISLFEEGEIKLAVCYYPFQKEKVLCAQKGKGAYLGDKRIHVSKTAKMSDAYLTFGGIRRFIDKKPLLRLVDSVMCARGLDPTYGHTLVVQGKYDITLDAYAQPWDSAPFKIFIEEAGGKITMLNGAPWNLNGRGFIATNGLLHTKALKIYNKG